MCFIYLFIKKLIKSNSFKFNQGLLLIFLVKCIKANSERYLYVIKYCDTEKRYIFFKVI